MPTSADLIDALDQGALFSPCRRWRYCAWRRWDADGPVVAFIDLCPSIDGDETTDDDHISRCVQLAKAWGYGAVHLVSLFAWRTDSISALKEQHENAIGPRNNEYLREVCRAADLTVAGWGPNGDWMSRADSVRSSLHVTGVKLHTLRRGSTGFPAHPTLTSGTPQPLPWPPLEL